jgi:hypothetical protein
MLYYQDSLFDLSVTPTPTPSITPTSITPTPTPSITPTPSTTPSSITPTPTVTPTTTPTPTPTVTPTTTPTPTPTVTPTTTPTPTPSAAPILPLGFIQTDTTFTNGNSAGCSGRSSSSVTKQLTGVIIGSAGTISQTVTLTSAQTNVWGLQTKLDIPSGTSWNAGTWTWRLNVTTANMNLTLTEVYICRINSSNVSQATIGSATGLGLGLGTTGVQSGTISGSAQTPSSGDYVNIVFVFTNAAMNTQSISVTHNQVIDTPLT